MPGCANTEPIEPSQTLPPGTREIGQRGEDAAVRCLQKHGYRILGRNYLCGAGEIDVVAEDCGTIAFVEVKARSPGSYLEPAQAVDEAKRERIRLAAADYLSDYPETGAVRYDIVSVYLDAVQQAESVELEKDAFR